MGRQECQEMGREQVKRDREKLTITNTHS